MQVRGMASLNVAAICNYYKASLINGLDRQNLVGLCNRLAAFSNAHFLHLESWGVA